MPVKILIIDDSPTANAVMSASLQEAGFEVESVLTGKDGVEKGSSGDFGLCIIDTILPDINGFEVCRAIRDKSGKAIKIIVMTGSIDAIDAVKARKSGADDYCVKTKDMEVLVGTVKKLI